VGAALRGGHDIDERLDAGLVAGAPAQRDVGLDRALDVGGRHGAVLVQHRHGLGERVGARQAQHVGDGRVDGQELTELGDAAAELEPLVPAVLGAAVGDVEGEARHQERRLPGARDQLRHRQAGVLEEDLPVGPVPLPGARDAPGDPADLAQAGLRGEGGVRPVAGEHPGDAAAEAGGPGRAPPVHLDVESGAQRVDHRRADAVEAAGGRVGARAEFAAGVQLREDHLDAGQAGARLGVHRHAARHVGHGDRPVLVEADRDGVAEAGQGLVDRVVDDLPEAVHQPLGVGRADVHGGPLAHRLEPLQDQQVPRLVVAVLRLRLGGRGHAASVPVRPDSAREPTLGVPDIPPDAPGSDPGWSVAAAMVEPAQE